MTRARTIGRFSGLAAAWAIGAFCMALLAAVALPNAIGMRSFTVMSGSMEPTIHVGDVVIDKKISPLDARPGDVVTFSDPFPCGGPLRSASGLPRPRGSSHTARESPCSVGGPAAAFQSPK